MRYKATSICVLAEARETPKMLVDGNALVNSMGSNGEFVEFVFLYHY